MTTRYELLMQKRIMDRQADASERSARVLRSLAQEGVEVRVIGSLADGRFGIHSDVDFLIERLPHDRLRYRIEGCVEDIMGPIPFDVIYADEVSWGAHP